MLTLWTLLLTMTLTTAAKSTKSYLIESIDESQEESLVSDLDDSVVSANKSLDDALETDGDDYQGGPGPFPPCRGRRCRRRGGK